MSADAPTQSTTWTNKKGTSQQRAPGHNALPSNNIDEPGASDKLILSSKEGLSKETTQKNNEKMDSRRHYNITWFNPPPYLKFHPEALYAGFETCEYSNCHMSFNQSDAPVSDAVIFDGRHPLTPAPTFKRRKNQVWIFAAHESPLTFNIVGLFNKPNWTGQFNWTMTYDRDSADIYLPYGEIRPRDTHEDRDYRAMAANKTKGALMINSHCHTSSKRELYVNELRKHTDVTVLGLCGQRWQCGTHYKHDDCFNILNDYKFFLAFENAYCHQYFTEKIFENFNFDTIIVTLGGHKEAENLFPKGIKISTDAFSSPKALGKYLTDMSEDEYAEMLRAKSEYHSVGYKTVYVRAMCDLCDKLNHQDKYRQSIKDIKAWTTPPCKK